MSKIAIIPARGGSKRIPRKNLKEFLGRPIIIYSIEVALKSQLFNEVIVSTDDDEIASIAVKKGAKVPFLRSKETAGDFATTSDVLNEVLSILEKKYNYACCIYPTAPFVDSSILRKAFDVLKEQKYDTVFPIVKYSYPIQRSLQVNNKKVAMVWPEHLNSRSQDLESRYHDAGQFYWFSVPVFFEKKKLFTDNSGYVLVDELCVQDIDNEMDWRLAEMKYNLLHG